MNRNRRTPCGRRGCARPKKPPRPPSSLGRAVVAGTPGTGPGRRREAKKPPGGRVHAVRDASARGTARGIARRRRAQPRASSCADEGPGGGTAISFGELAGSLRRLREETKEEVARWPDPLRRCFGRRGRRHRWVSERPRGRKEMRARVFWMTGRRCGGVLILRDESAAVNFRLTAEINRGDELGSNRPRRGECGGRIAGPGPGCGLGAASPLTRPRWAAHHPLGRAPPAGPRTTGWAARHQLGHANPAGPRATGWAVRLRKAFGPKSEENEILF
jgi:hypothetical protein